MHVLLQSSPHPPASLPAHKSGCGICSDPDVNPTLALPLTPPPPLARARRVGAEPACRVGAEPAAPTLKPLLPLWPAPAEWVQNLQNFKWSEEEVNDKLDTGEPASC